MTWRFPRAADSTLDTLDERYRSLFCRRALVGLWAMLASLLLFSAADVLAGLERRALLVGLKVVQLPLVLAALVALRTPAGRRHAQDVMLAMLTVNALAMVPIGLARGDATTAGTLLNLATLSAAFMLPWDPLRQSSYATLATAVTWFLTIAIEPRTAHAIYPALARTVLNVGSIVVAYLGQKSRADQARMEAALREGTQSLVEANAELEEESQANAALLHVTATLQRHLRDPDLPARVNGLAVETLACDWSSTFLWDARRGGLILQATAGAPPEIAADVGDRAFPVPATTHDVFDSTQTASIDRRTDGVDELIRRYGVSAYLCTPIRRDVDVCGLLVHGYTGGERTFTPRQRRIAVGIARATAMALENARLIADLERASVLKSEFVATMSHELRTPLNIVVGYGDMLLEGACGLLAPDAVQAVTRIRQSSVDLLELVNATLDLNRLDAGREPLDVAAVSLAPLLAEIVAEVGAMRAEGVVLRTACEPPAACVMTDRAKLKTIVRNLLGNACKFTPAGEITLIARTGARALEIVVRDTGIGIAADDQAIIFEMFRQVDGSMTRRFDGVGLGLHIVQRLVTLLDGTIDVESRPGAGSTFTVRLPAATEETLRPTGS
jgi:signal transduction histidine kinase